MLASALLAAESTSWWWIPYLLNTLILLVGLFLILLVLIQRGKGGGLAGAFGGAGGSSAFGSRAGDQFTRITIIVATVWILLIMTMVKLVPAFLPQQESTKPSGSIWKPPVIQHASLLPAIEGSAQDQTII